MLLGNSCHDLQAPLLSPTVFNPTKNSIGTNRVGLSKSDCTSFFRGMKNLGKFIDQKEVLDG